MADNAYICVLENERIHTLYGIENNTYGRLAPGAELFWI